MRMKKKHSNEHATVDRELFDSFLFYFNFISFFNSQQEQKETNTQIKMKTKRASWCCSFISFLMHSFCHIHTRTYKTLPEKIYVFIFVAFQQLIFSFSLYFKYIFKQFFGPLLQTRQPNTSNIWEILKTSCAQKYLTSDDSSSRAATSTTTPATTRGEFA